MTTRLLKSSENINGLPIGFQEVEYLQSSGTQYIDTGYTINTVTDEVELYYQLTDGTQYKWIFGEHDTNARFGLGSGDGTNRRNVAYATSTVQKADTYFMSSQHYYKASTAGVYIDGTKMVDYSSFSSTSTIYLFNLNLNGSTTYCSQARIWGYKHKRDGVLIRDFIPALNPAGRPCMYDLVGKKAYYNIGTGEFTYGRKIIPVEYLESTGTQYVDTGYIPKPTSTYKSMFQLTNIATTSGNWFCIFGSVESNSSTFTELFLPRASGGGDVNQILAGSHNSTYLRTDYPWAVNTKYNFEMTPTAVLINDVSQGSISVDSSITCSHSIYLFARHEYNDAVRYNVSAKIHSFTIYEGNTLVRDYIPCIDENNVGYMFDKVTHACYLNAGTGTFNYGKKLYSSKVRLYKDSEANKLPAGFKRVEYLESTGTQYILTGFTPTLNTDFEIELSSTSTGQNRWVIGCPTWVGVHYKGATNEVGVTCSSTAAFQQYVSYAHDNSRLTMKLVGSTVYANGVELGTITKRAGSLDFALFGYRDSNAGATLFFIGSIYKTKIWDNNTLVHNFIPALDTTNTPCMYDTVTQTAFYNQGTGEFTYGAIIPNKVRLSQSTEIRFPKGYTEVEYLESDSTAYIDTGVSGANDNLKIEMGFSYSKFTAYGYFFSNYESESANVTRFCLNGTDTNYGLAYINTKSQNGAIYTSNFSKNNFHTFILTKTSVSIDGNTTTNNNPPVGTANTKNIILFNRGSGSYTEKRDVGMRCYYFRIYDNNTLIRYFIPALDPNGKPCMWDVVTKQPFYNAGTGEFGYGRAIQQVEYIESTGTQYVNTGIKLTNNYSVELDYQLTQATQSRTGLFGALNMTGSNQGRIGSILSPSNQQLEHGYGAGNDYWQQGKPDTNRHILYQKQNETYFDGALIHTFDTATFSLDMSAYLGNFVFTNYTPAKAKYYSSRWWDGNTLVRNYVPAIDSNNVGFMFDRVTHTIFDNVGTGSFTYGSPVPNKIRN